MDPWWNHQPGAQQNVNGQSAASSQAPQMEHNSNKRQKVANALSGFSQQYLEHRQQQQYQQQQVIPQIPIAGVNVQAPSQASLQGQSITLDANLMVNAIESLMRQGYQSPQTPNLGTSALTSTVEDQARRLVQGILEQQTAQDQQARDERTVSHVQHAIGQALAKNAASGAQPPPAQPTPQQPVPPAALQEQLSSLLNQRLQNQWGQPHHQVQIMGQHQQPQVQQFQQQVSQQVQQMQQQIQQVLSQQQQVQAMPQQIQQYLQAQGNLVTGGAGNGFGQVAIPAGQSVGLAGSASQNFVPTDNNTSAGYISSPGVDNVARGVMLSNTASNTVRSQIAAEHVAHFSSERPTPNEGCRTLELDVDKNHLSRFQTIVRQHLEFFQAKPDDVRSGKQGRKKPVFLGQVGIRCLHCADLPLRQRGRAAVYYPKKLVGVYQAAQNQASGHLCEACPRIPEFFKVNLRFLRDQRETAGGGKQYWADGAAEVGIYETPEGLLMMEPGDTNLSSVLSSQETSSSSGEEVSDTEQTSGSSRNAKGGESRDGLAKEVTESSSSDGHQRKDARMSSDSSRDGKQLHETSAGPSKEDRLSSGSSSDEARSNGLEPDATRGTTVDSSNTPATLSYDESTDPGEGESSGLSGQGGDTDPLSSISPADR